MDQAEDVDTRSLDLVYQGPIDTDKTLITSLPLALHESCRNVYTGPVAASAKRINVTLDDEHAGKLARLAERTHVQEGTLARSLLATALDDADPDAARITEILDAIPGAWERTQEGLAQAARGEGTPLDELA